MSFINVEIEGEGELQRRFQALAGRSVHELGVVRAMNSELEAVMRDSRALVPVVTGTLRSSGTVDAPQIQGNEVTQTCGYGGAAKRYALKVHENPRAGRTGGYSPSGKKYYPRPGLPVPYSTVGQWKFLEQPFLARRTRIIEAITDAMNRSVEGGR